MRTLQELANFLDLVVAVDEDGETWAYESTPRMYNSIFGRHDGHWGNTEESPGESYRIPNGLVKYDGDWKDSLTFPRYVI
jgi:hypothetical protein